MHIHSAEFVVGAASRTDWPTDGLPEVAFCGRSNVGKSSLINRLVQRKQLARTSSTPGKTQQLNYYRIDSRFYLVDFPGYGFTAGGVELREILQGLIWTYLESRQELQAVVQLIDARHGPTALDQEVIEWLRRFQRPFLLVFTKADKLSRHQLQQRFELLSAEGYLSGISFVPFSAITGQGSTAILQWILDQAGIARPDRSMPAP